MTKGRDFKSYTDSSKAKRRQEKRKKETKGNGTKVLSAKETEIKRVYRATIHKRIKVEKRSYCDNLAS
jgi:hypothetical protein